MGLFTKAIYSGIILGMMGGTDMCTPSVLAPPQKYVEESPLPTTLVDHLIVNLTNTEQTYAIKNEQDRVVDLQRLATQSQFEEAWIYVPQDQTWAEVGYSESTVRIGDLITKQSRNDHVRIKRLVQKYDRLVHYHIHPFTVLDYEEDKKRFTKRLKVLPTPAILEQIINNMDKGQYVFPGAPDLYFMVIWSRDFYKLHPQGDISFKNVSPFGVTEYKLTEQGHQLFSLNLLQLQQFMDKAVSSDNTFFWQMQHNWRRAASYTWVLEKITETCQQMSNNNYTVKFTSFEQEVKKD